MKKARIAPGLFAVRSLGGRGFRRRRRVPLFPRAGQGTSAEDIADYLKLSTDSTERRVVTRPDFPAPLQPCDTGPRAAKRWFAIDVRAWARKNASKLPTGRAGRKAA